jgi:response regulator RpfG family c-di-GMP phosphodiesterase
MPGMDGIELLSRVRERAPDTVRVMLTGNADLEATIRAVNEGNIFRFLTKPCPPDDLAKALNDALAQYGLVLAEKELLNKTLNGSIRLLTDILSMIDPGSFGKAQVMRDAIAKIAAYLSLENAWEIHLAVMVAPIGCITIPPDILVKARTGAPLEEAEAHMLERVPEFTARLLANIPRLEGVARIVRHQHARVDGSGYSMTHDSIPTGSRLLKILSDMFELEAKGVARLDALAVLNSREGCYDPTMLSGVRAYYESVTPGRPQVQPASHPTAVKKLEPGMMLSANVVATDGTVVLPAGQQLNEMALEKLQNYARAAVIQEPILVETDRTASSDTPSDSSPAPRGKSATAPQKLGRRNAARK